MDQSNLSIGGIGTDPSGSHPTGNLLKYWASSIDDMTIVFKPSSLGIMTDPGATATDATDTYYSKELASTGKDLITLTTPASGDSQITFAWQWFNSLGTSFDGTGEQSGGTWTDCYTLTASATTNPIINYDAAEEDILYKGSKFRVKMVVTDAGSNGVAAGLVTAAVAALNHTSSGASIRKNIDKQAKYNTGITIGGIGADPS